jgi:hypothetical protein
MINLEIQRSKSNPFQIDLKKAGFQMPLSATDKLWFTAKATIDGPALISKGTTSASLSGIVITDVNEGLAELVIDPPDSDGIEERVLVYDVQFAADSDDRPLQVQWGFAYLTDTVTSPDS